MKVKLIDQPFLLNTYSLDKHSLLKSYPIILRDHGFKKTIFVMVKGYKPVANNKYEVMI